MKVLVVCSHNRNRISPFISEQVKSLNKLGVSTEYFLINGKGVKGYLGNLKNLRKKIKEYNPDLIHAHYGLSGLLACLQFSIPVVTTFHGSDVHQKKNLKYSKLAHRLSKKSIFVSSKLMEIVGAKEHIIPCGVDIEIFKPIDKYTCRESFKIGEKDKVVLFPASKENKIKNYSLAKAAIDLINEKRIEKVTLYELSGFSREEVVKLMNAADLMLLTSFNEGSPQVIKESMACNRPIVSTKVGAVPDMLKDVQGSYLVDFKVDDVARNIEKCFQFESDKSETNGREIVFKEKLDLDSVAKKIIEVYRSVLSN